MTVAKKVTRAKCLRTANHSWVKGTTKAGHRSSGYCRKNARRSSSRSRKASRTRRSRSRTTSRKASRRRSRSRTGSRRRSRAHSASRSSAIYHWMAPTRTVYVAPRRTVYVAPRLPAPPATRTIYVAPRKSASRPKTSPKPKHYFRSGPTGGLACDIIQSPAVCNSTGSCSWAGGRCQ